MWAVLGGDQVEKWPKPERESDPKGTSWGALGAYVGGVGPSEGQKWPKPEREGDLASGSRPKSGPGSIGLGLV